MNLFLDDDLDSWPNPIPRGNTFTGIFARGMIHDAPPGADMDSERSRVQSACRRRSDGKGRHGRIHIGIAGEKSTEARLL